MNFINSENPFVHNPYFYASQTQLSFEQTPFYLIHKSNNYIAVIIGMFLNALVIYLIVYKTPSHFRPYSKMLLLCQISDLLAILCHFLCQTRVKVANGSLLMTFTGPVSYFKYDIQCKGITFQALGAILGCLVLPFQYLFRFKLVQNRQPPNVLQTCLYFCVPLFIGITAGLSTIPGYCPAPETLGFVGFEQYWFVEVPTPTLIVGSLANRMLLLNVAYISVIVSASYLLSIWLAKRTIIELSKSVIQQNEKSKDLQRQFGRTLFAQSLIPLCTSFIPVLITATAIFMQFDIGHASDFIMGTIIWFPALNSLSTIIFIVPYRRACIKKLTKNKVQASTHYSSTHQSQQRTPNIQ